MAEQTEVIFVLHDVIREFGYLLKYGYFNSIRDLIPVSDLNRFSRFWAHVKQPYRTVSYLEDSDGDSALHLHQWRIRSQRVNATNNRQRLRLEIWRKHVLVQVDFVLGQTAERFVFDERKTHQVPCTLPHQHPHDTALCPIKAPEHWRYNHSFAWKNKNTFKQAGAPRLNMHLQVSL